MENISFTLYAIHDIDHETFGPKKFADLDNPNIQHPILNALKEGVSPEEIKTTGDNFGTFPITDDIEKHKQEISERTGIPVNEILIQYNAG